MKTSMDAAQIPNPDAPDSGPITLNRFLDALPYPAYYKDASGVYLGCNQAFRRQILCGCTEEIIGRSLADLKDNIPAGLLRLYMQKDAEILEKAGQQVFEAKVRCGDGITRTFAFYKSILKDDHGTVIGIAGLML
ncbi:MAG: PAS domain-containing protein, partial [Desulfobacteraceae bacterium]